LTGELLGAAMIVAAFVGVALIVAGIAVLAGAGWALISAGVLTVTGVVALYDPGKKR
jgi:hypothetical protein